MRRGRRAVDVSQPGSCGHGFGMRRDPHPINDWPARCAEWMKSMGFLGGK
jgi:hypothetical protein